MRINRVLLVLYCAVSVSLIPCSVTSAEPQLVDIEMVLAVDISSSVDDAEYDLQMTGLAAAFRHPEVISAVESLKSGGLALGHRKLSLIGAGYRTSRAPHGSLIS